MAKWQGGDGEKKGMGTAQLSHSSAANSSNRKCQPRSDQLRSRSSAGVGVKKAALKRPRSRGAPYFVGGR